MKLATGFLIGWASASALMFAVLCWRSLREADNAGLHALAELDPITPRPEFVANLLDFPLWETELAKEDI